MDQFLIVYNPLRRREDRVMYILHPRPPRVLISVTPLFKDGLTLDEEAHPCGIIFHSKYLRNDFKSVQLKIEMDLQADGNGKHVPLNPKLEKILSRAWRWFTAFELRTPQMTNEYDLPEWMVR